MLTDEYVNPCTPGLALGTCIGCGVRVVAVTLNPWDQCVQCARDKRADDTGQMRLR